LAHEEMVGPDGDGYRHMIETSAAQRIGTPSDVADAAAFLLGADGSFVTGSDLLIDGGVSAAMRNEESAAR
jgi:NAD(P)-dependent dehydrogenase (short-subunit alcohol dehydrogenase family)